MVLSWHTPESLYAEIGLCSLAILIFAYRFLGGQNEWLKTHGVILVTFYAVGSVAYDELEGWPLLDSSYFLTVTITTVGYGDLCPTTAAGKIFTVFYALVGIIFVFAALQPLVEALLWFKDIVLSPFKPADLDDAPDTETLDELRARGHWGFKYFGAVAGPLIIFILGLIIGFTVMNLNLVDGIYWSMITMTTIGYGDISANTFYAKIVLCLYLPTAVAALADAMAVLQTIGTAKKLIETDFAEVADNLLLGEAGGANPNPDETLTEAEFLISVLKENSIVDDMTVAAIRKQFEHITRHDTWSADPTNKVLDDRIVFLEMKAQGRIAQGGGKGGPKNTPKGHEIAYCDLKKSDNGFAEWKEKHWLPRVFDGKPHGVQVRMAPAPPGGKNKTVVDAETGEKKQFTRLQETNGTAPKSDTPTRGGAYFSDAAAMADGEYVWMPHDQARRHRNKGNDKDLGLWFLLAAFAVYFVWKILPTVFDYHAAEAADAAAEAVDAVDASRRLLLGAGDGADSAAAAANDSLVAGLRVGEMLTAEMLDQIKRLAERR